MSTILPHMVWPSCEFRMQVWNVLHVARWKYRTQKWRKKIAIWFHFFLTAIQRGILSQFPSALNIPRYIVNHRNNGWCNGRTNLENTYRRPYLHAANQNCQSDKLSHRTKLSFYQEFLLYIFPSPQVLETWRYKKLCLTVEQGRI